MVSYVTVTIRRDVPYPLDTAYAWLTDYQDDDPARAGAIVTKREVIERAEDKVILHGGVATLGIEREGRGEISLHPPDRWEAQLYDAKERKADHYEYRLEPRGEEACELIVDYHFIAPKLKHKVKLNAAKPAVRRELEKMWDGFFAAMDEELTQAEA